MKNYNKNFDQIIGYQDIKETLYPICDMFRNPEKYIKLGVVMPSGVVLHGEPGFGKTLMAKSFIEACGVPSFICRKDKSDGEFINYLTKCFDDAVENAPAIVFLDDMDKFANEDEDHKNAEEYVTVQACIDKVKGKNVFVIATTNALYNLPDSLLRPGRFDINLTMDGLEKKDQIDLIKYYLKDKPVEKDISYDSLWHILGGHVSCAELEKIINDAAIKAAFKNMDLITYNDFVDACLKHHFGIVNEVNKELTKKNYIIAYHEAGHTIVSELLEPNSVGLVSIQGRTSNRGVTKYTIDDYERGQTYIEAENRIAACLAGRAATEIVLNEKDLGAAEDIDRAKDIIFRLRNEAYVYGFNCNLTPAVSEEKRARACRVMDSELERLYEKAKKIIYNNREFLDAVANALLEKKTIFAKDIQDIKKKLNIA